MVKHLSLSCLAYIVNIHEKICMAMTIGYSGLHSIMEILQHSFKLNFGLYLIKTKKSNGKDMHYKISKISEDKNI